MRNQKSNINETLLGKVPPQAIEVEEAVLGALMLERDALEVVSGIIDTQSFYKESNQKLFETIKAIAAKKKPTKSLLCALLLS